MLKGTSCGIIPVRKGVNGGWEFLVLQASDNEGSWTFPKGFQEPKESLLETALREIQEEAGLSENDFTVLEEHVFYEEYEALRHGVEMQKNNTYFLALVEGNPEITLQATEIQQFKWTSYQEARDLFSYPSRQAMIDSVNNVLNTLA